MKIRYRQQLGLAVGEPLARNRILKTSPVGGEAKRSPEPIGPPNAIDRPAEGIHGARMASIFQALGENLIWLRASAKIDIFAQKFTCDFRRARSVRQSRVLHQSTRRPEVRLLTDTGRERGRPPTWSALPLMTQAV